MSYRQLLDEAIGDAPASRIDVDQVITRQRRNGRLRRWGVCGAGAAAVLAVTATAALVLPTAGRHPEPTVPAVPAVPRITTVAGTPEDLARLDAAVIASVTRQAPEVKWEDQLSPGQPRWRYGAGPPNTVENYFGAGWDRGQRGRGAPGGADRTVREPANPDVLCLHVSRGRMSGQRGTRRCAHRGVDRRPGRQGPERWATDFEPAIRDRGPAW